MDEETMVEQEEVTTAADDTPQEGATEEVDTSEEISLEAEDISEGEEPAEDAEEKPGKQGAKEPGWIKQRVEKAVSKAVADAVAQTESRMKAEFEKQMAPIREKMLEDEARELVRKGTVKDLATAKELVRYRQGQPQTNASETPRNEKGQFTSRSQTDAGTKAQIAMLTRQADKIKARDGIDVTQTFMQDPDVKRKVVSGEWDFYDVAEHVKAQQKETPVRKAPAPMRSPNGASGSEKSTIASMSDEQFEKFEKRVKGGTRFKV